MKSKTQIPAAVEVEKMIIGGMFLEPETLENVYPILKPHHFYDKRLREIYEVIIELDEQNIPVDIITVYEHAKKTNRNIAATHLSEIAESVSTASQIVYHCRIVYEKYILRKTIEQAQTVIAKAYQENDVFDLLGDAIKNLENLSDEGEQIKEDRNLANELQTIFEQINHERESELGIGWSTENFPTFNKSTGGLQRGEVLVISGIDKAGKTTFGLSLLIDFVTRSNIPAAVFTLEMPFDQYARKIISIATPTRYGYLRTPGERKKDGSYYYDNDQFQRTAAQSIRLFNGKKLFIVDEIIDDIGIKAKIKYLHRKHGIELFMVDYIGLVECKTKKERRDLEIAQVSRMLKQIAMELKVAIIVISQENDEGSTAESKALRRDCDFWFSISHPIDLGKEQIKYEGQSYPIDQGYHVVIFKRSRHSANGGIFFCYYMKGGAFKEIDIRYQERLNM